MKRSHASKRLTILSLLKARVPRGATLQTYAAKQLATSSIKRKVHDKPDEFFFLEGGRELVTLMLKDFKTNDIV